MKASFYVVALANLLPSAAACLVGGAGSRQAPAAVLGVALASLCLLNVAAAARPSLWKLALAIDLFFFAATAALLWLVVGSWPMALFEALTAALLAVSALVTFVL